MKAAVLMATPFIKSLDDGSGEHKRGRRERLARVAQ